jgi:Fuc2NAc and GlcNAc transferase
MTFSTSLIVLAAWAFSYVLVGAMRRLAIKQNLLDVPNARSSHVVATPRGGGAGIVIVFLAAITALFGIGFLPIRSWVGFVVSGSVIAAVGYFDDKRHLKASTRLLVHFGAAIFFVVVCGGYPNDQLAKLGLHGAAVGGVFSVLVLVWGTNLFNFMDGIDGIAATEAIYITLTAALLCVLNGGEIGLTMVLFVVSAASLGFLHWNWPPAQIFMGDIGSGFLGFVVSAGLMATTVHGNLPLEVAPILGGVFVIDATITLIRRVLQGEKWSEPHRTHAYQQLARRFGSHRPATLIVLAVNVIWLLPWAIASARFPERGLLFTTAALLPLVIVSIIVGAGRRETKTAA